MTSCCGRPRATRFCPECGKRMPPAGAEMLYSAGALDFLDLTTRSFREDMTRLAMELARRRGRTLASREDAILAVATFIKTIMDSAADGPDDEE
jgi:hypothetical protein